jgi:hypothetical protein
MARIPQPISPREAETVRSWISRVGPDDGVLATSEVTAPLSSRKRLCSYIREQNQLKGFLRLGPKFPWAFVRSKDFDPKVFGDQGFEVVQRREVLTISHRQVSLSERRRGGICPSTTIPVKGGRPSSRVDMPTPQDRCKLSTPKKGGQDTPGREQPTALECLTLS